MSKSPSLRRIQADIRELAFDPSDRYSAAPLENDMFEWHFTIKGADETDFQGGIYHGRILLPPEYPFKPPHIIFLTPTGRFDINTKVCLSFSAYHPELWQPAWGIRLILEALISFLPTPADGAIGALDWTPTERKKLAIKSQSYCCPQCGPIKNLIPPTKSKQSSATSTTMGIAGGGGGMKTAFQKQIEELQRLQQLAHAKPTEITATTTTESTATIPEQQGSLTGKSTTSEAGAVQVVEDDDKKEAAVVTTKDPENDNDNKEAESDIIPQSRKEDAAELVDEATTTTTTESVVPEEKKPTSEPPIDESLPKETSSTAISTEEEQQQLDETNKSDPATTTTTTEEEPQQQRPQQPEPTAAVAAVVQDNNRANTATSIILSSKFLDPFLQGIIVLLSIICYLLLRKIQSLVADIQALEYSNNTE